MRPLTILHTEWSDGWGGQERRILAEMAGLVGRGHRLLLACRPACRLGREAAGLGIPVFHFPFAGQFDGATIRGLMGLVRAEGVDLLNTHSGIDSWVGGIAARLAGVRLVRTRHLNLPLKRNWLNFVHYLPHAVVTCGTTMRQQLLAGGFPAEEVVSIPTGIDFPRFQPARPRGEVRRALGIGDATFMVLMVGVIRGVKRHEVALRAFAEFRRHHADAALVLAGEGPMRVDMERLAAERSIADAVHFLGHRDDVPDLLGAADCLLLTSRSEGVPQAVTQALGCGLPVVATAVGGVPELIIDGSTGLLAPAEGVGEVAAALARLAADRTLAGRLGAGGRDHALRHHSLEAMLDATEALYARLLGAAR
ncbi:MAG TPA: glycosyltransferase family 4 protein [Rhodocyclaceae bacterium]|nr:glycosyltransferase family 4 protein [Rhodocyclaceae bacterium]